MPKHPSKNEFYQKENKDLKEVVFGLGKSKDAAIYILRSRQYPQGVRAVAAWRSVFPFAGQSCDVMPLFLSASAFAPAAQSFFSQDGESASSGPAWLLLGVGKPPETYCLALVSLLPVYP